MWHCARTLFRFCLAVHKALQRALQASALWAIGAAVVLGALQFVASCALFLGGGIAADIAFAFSSLPESG